VIEHEETTAPEDESRSRFAPPMPLETRWVFPIEAFTPLRLSGARLTIGRELNCKAHLDLPSVSRLHAEIYRDGPVFAIRDLGSRNGTFLNGQRVAHGALALGDVIRIGECVGVVATAAGAPVPLRELAPDLYGGEALAAAIDAAQRVATTTLPMVIVGETGTGKERVARAIHHWSGRTGRFHAINCAALPDNLVEAELFGHARGAFTGAHQTNLGRVRAANDGTLFLDEIADLPLSVQPKLLRLLEEGAVVPLGSSDACEVDVRVVAASQTPLETLVERGTFRRDLRARLAGLVVRLPPLRERRAEVVPLFMRLLDVHTGGRPPSIEGKVAEALSVHAWPDNVRELDLLVRRLLALHGSEPILRRGFLPPELTRQLGTSQVPIGPAAASRSQHDFESLKTALGQTNGNVKAAAARLGFSRQRAYRLMGTKKVDEILAGVTESAETKLDGGSGKRPEDQG
jgi:transcriptional regulator with AAA-type ATPase domain